MGFSYKKIDHIDLTIFTVEGPVSVDRWIAALEEYNRTGATRLEIYDLRKGNGEFTGSDARRLHYGTSPETSVRTASCKTAILASHPVQYGMARVYCSYAEVSGVPWKVEIFYSARDAAEWLGIDLTGLIPEM